MFHKQCLKTSLTRSINIKISHGGCGHDAGAAQGSSADHKQDTSKNRYCQHFHQMLNGKGRQGGKLTLAG